MTTYKTGPHLITPSVAGMKLARVAPCVKALDNVAPLREARPDALRVFRATGLPSDRAQAVALILGRLGGYRHPNLIVEPDNERERDWNDADLEWIVAALHAAGVKVAVKSWATGAYELVDWQRARARNWWDADYISVHAYWANHGFTQWNGLRFRSYWQLGDPLILVTECGRDRVRDAPATPDNPEGWDGNGGWTKDHIEGWQHIGEIVAYDGEIARLSCVAGAFLYTFGPYPGDPGPGKHDARPFDCDGLVDLLLPHYAAQPIPIPSGGGDMPTKPVFLFAFKALAEELGADVVGEPLEDQGPQNYDAFKNVVLFTTKGIMFYNERLNKAHFVAGVFPKASGPII